MKTTDLIPLILYQLVDGDKYGYEIVKQIEDASNGYISIKQPTLYSVLKKLEHGRIISSYWQDSDIGGKRHYYKLTDNGRAQLDTYPSFEQLIKDACEDSPAPVASKPATNIESEPEPQPINTESLTQMPKAEITTMANGDGVINEIDNFDTIGQIDKKGEDIPTYGNTNTFEVNDLIVEEDVIIKPIKIDLTSPIEAVDTNNVVVEEDQKQSISIFDVIEPAESSSDEIFRHKDSAITTSMPDISQEQVLSPAAEQNIAENISLPNPEPDMSAFVNNINPISISNTDSALYDKLSPNQDLQQAIEAENNDIVDNAPEIEQVKYLSYTDFNSDKVVVKRRKAISKHIFKMLLTSATLLLLFAITFAVSNKYGFSKLYYACIIIVCLYLLLYPIITLRRLPKLRLRYCSKPFIYVLKHDLFVKLSIFLSVIICVLGYNISVISSISNLFAICNFSQFIAPIMLGATIMIDFAYNALLYKDYTK